MFPKYLTKTKSPLNIALIILLGIGLFATAANFWKIKRFFDHKIMIAKYGKTANGELQSVFFKKINLGKDADGKYSSLTIGPNNKLYAASIDGKIKSYFIKNDGSIKLEHTYAIFGSYQKLLIGLHFDPNANEENLIAWITYSDSPELENGPAWDGRLARVTLDHKSNTVLKNELILTNLPRSGSDHLTNSIDFGEDGRLYISQGSNTAMGLADHSPNWLHRSESLLSGSILALNLSKLPNILPIDTKTADGGGTYNPFKKNTPLTIYATGIRNAYDLVWHSNGNLFTTLNGSRFGEITPTSDPNSPLYITPHPHYKYTGATNIPSVNKVEPAQNDYLASIKEGRYYGHPNPLRAEYILNHGDSDVENPEYNGIQPDSNFHEYVYDFGKHASANGIAEYKANIFNGQLKGCLIIARLAPLYNDIIILRPDANGNIINDYDGKNIGLNNMNYPLDLTENPNTGDIYVAEYGNQKITLFKPQTNLTPSDIIAENSLKNEETVKKVSTLNGKEIYERNCQICHGVNGKGVSGPNLTDDEWIYGDTEKDILNIIKNGSENGSMPAWSKILNEKEIKKVEEYILYF